MEKRHMLHVTLYCSAMSPCGKYIAVGNNFGFISVFNLSDSVQADSTEVHQKPFCEFKAHSGSIHALVTSSKLLISAGDGPIVAWRWHDISNNKVSKAFTLNKESNLLNNVVNVETYNCLSYNSKDNVLYSGGGDGVVLAWDIKTEKNVESFEGHKDYVHEVDMTSNCLVSAGEDGLVKVWDTRSAQCNQTIEPCKNNKLKRPGQGKWISSVAVDTNGQWIACGGGPKTSLWHLRSSSHIATLSEGKMGSSDFAPFSPNTIKFFDDEIIAGGNQSNLYRWHANGESKAVIPCSIRNVFSISFKPVPNKEQGELPMIVTGNSPRIDLFTNLGYRGTSLNIRV